MSDSTGPRDSASSDGGSSDAGSVDAGSVDHGAWAHPSGEQPAQIPAEQAPFEQTAAEQTAPVATVEAPPADQPRQARRGYLVPVLVAAVIAALIGGGIGAGTVALLRPAANDVTTTGSGSTGTSNVVVNDPQSATAITAVAAKASPSVVTINVTATNGSEAGTGSGIVLKSDGYILTNNHVVTLDGATANDSITATTNDGRNYRATVVGTDPINDLAVIKLQNVSGMTAASFADSSKLNVGDTAIAIGAPLGLSGTVTNGIVSALNRSIEVQSSAVTGNDDSSGGDSSGENSPFNFWNFGNGSGTQSTGTPIALSVIQTDAAINPGNSGGALLNGSGQVIGVNVAIASAGSTSSSSGQSGSIGVGFAIPSNVATRIADDLMNGKKATHGLLGASLAASTTGSVAGATVGKLTAGGAGAKSGLAVGDVVTRFNGVAVQSASDLTAQVRALPGGASTTLTYVRNGAAHTVSVTLGTYQAQG